jgi:putative ABC transport system permease protein
VLKRALVQLAIGLPIGMAGAFGVGRVLQSLLVQTSPSDPVTLGSIMAVLVGVAILACLWPARRAARLDPMIALRYE